MSAWHREGVLYDGKIELDSKTPCQETCVTSCQACTPAQLNPSSPAVCPDTYALDRPPQAACSATSLWMMVPLKVSLASGWHRFWNAPTGTGARSSYSSITSLPALGEMWPSEIESNEMLRCMPYWD